MIMTVVEAKKRAHEFEMYYADFIKLQNFALGLDVAKLDTPERTAREELLKLIQTTSDARLDIRTLFTLGAQMCANEVARIQNIIDNSEVNI